MRGGKGHQQKTDGQHEPSLIRIPERADRGDHAVTLGFGGKGEEKADAKVKAVKHHIEKDRRPHQGGEDQGQGFGVKHGLTPPVAGWG